MNNNKMELNNLSKEELLLQCEKMGILKCKSKNNYISYFININININE